MSETKQPAFFGGLPSRAASETPQPAPSGVPGAVSIAGTDRGGASGAARVNRLALIALVGSVLVAPVGLICGAIAVRQIRETGERGRSLAVGGFFIGAIELALGVAAVAVLLVGGPQLVGSIVGAQDTTANPAATTAPVSAKEAAAAKAAIASGGGAIPGHIVSAELCTAVKAYTAAGDSTPTSTDVAPPVLAAMEQLAAVESPNQKTYRAFVEMTKDPASVPSIVTAQAVAADFAKAVQVDVTTCA